MVDTALKIAQPIIIFDGVCNFCSESIQFVIRHDPAGIFKFAPLQSETGRLLLAKHGIDPVAVNTFLLVERDMASVRSEAALRIARRFAWHGVKGAIYQFDVQSQFAGALNFHLN